MKILSPADKVSRQKIIPNTRVNWEQQKVQEQYSQVVMTRSALANYVDALKCSDAIVHSPGPRDPTESEYWRNHENWNQIHFGQELESRLPPPSNPRVRRSIPLPPKSSVKTDTNGTVDEKSANYFDKAAEDTATGSFKIVSDNLHKKDGGIPPVHHKSCSLLPVRGNFMKHELYFATFINKEIIMRKVDHKKRSDENLPPALVSIRLWYLVTGRVFGTRQSDIERYRGAAIKYLNDRQQYWHAMKNHPNHLKYHILLVVWKQYVANTNNKTVIFYAASLPSLPYNESGEVSLYNLILKIKA